MFSLPFMGNVSHTDINTTCLAIGKLASSLVATFSKPCKEATATQGLEGEEERPAQRGNRFDLTIRCN